MSKIDDLVKLFDIARNRHGTDEAGVRAIVRALRDEMDRQRGDDWRWGDTVYFFNEILGDAGNEKVAADKNPLRFIDAAKLREKIATDPDIPCEAGADPAPAVCEITAERDRLKAAITTHVAGCVACGGSGVVFLCPELDNTAEAVREDCEECVGLRKELGDAS